MPNTIEDNVRRLRAVVPAIGNAIIAKGGTVNEGDGLEEFAADIATIPSGGGSASKKDVYFYDYDGNVVKSYTADEFANLSELPANPVHDGLIAQGWNWTLSNAKTYVATYGKLEIGQMYTTSDGKTRLYISLSEGRLSPVLKLYLNANTEVDIDWGDGSSHSTWTTTSEAYKDERHNYEASGDYVIAITVVAGSIILQSSSGSLSTLLTNGTTNPNSPDRAYLNSIHKIEIGSNITNIGNIIFQYCYALTSITIPNSVTSIGNSTFQYCYALTSITIPNSVTSIAGSAFQYCYSLTSITIPNTVTSIAGSAFRYCYSLTSITIPNSVTSIGNSTFQYCYSLSSITIPNTVTSIGNSTFYYCYALTSITIPNGVTSIGTEAFYNCYALTSITIPNSVTSIGNNAFSGCYSLTSITIPNGVTSIGSTAFQNCYSLTSITIPNGVTSIGSTAFQNCYSLSSITIPNSVTSIGSSAFNNCYALTSITIPNSVTSIAGNAFTGCSSLSSITIPNTVTSIGNSTFYYCYALTSITIPNTVTSIANSTFSNCYSLTSITIPNGVTSIGSSAFSSCYSFGYVKFTSTTPPTISNINAWSSLPTDCYILIPYDTLDDYLNGTNMPDDSQYLHLCFATYAEDVALPTEDSDGYTLTWYASKEDARAGTNPITVGNGKEIYAVGV